MNQKENDLNECRRVFHHAILRINSIFENNKDEFSFTLTDNMKNYLEGKSVEEKFQYYFEKLIKYQEYKEKREISLIKENENKDSKILSLNREIFLRNNMTENEKENAGYETKSKKRHSAGSNIINSVLNSEISKSIFKTNNKRKFGEISNPLSLLNFNNLNSGENTNNSNNTNNTNNSGNNFEKEQIAGFKMNYNTLQSSNSFNLPYTKGNLYSFNQQNLQNGSDENKN